MRLLRCEASAKLTFLDAQRSSAGEVVHVDDRQFDSITKKLASGANRRVALKGLLGIGIMTAAGLGGHDRAGAARRGFSGPSILPTPAPICIADGQTCSADPAECCSGYCCVGIHNPTGVCCTPPEK